jgi:hypothetical protein
VAARARDQISNAFEGWAKAEKAKSFFDAEGAVLDAITTTSQYPTMTATVTPPTRNTNSGGGGSSSSDDAVYLPLAFWAWLW